MINRSTSFRPEIWEQAITETIRTSLFFGHGNAAQASLAVENHVFPHPHSIFVSTFYYSGIVGLLSLIAMLTATLVSLYKLESSALRTVAVSVTIVGVAGLIFDGDKPVEKINFLWISLWLPVSLAITATNKELTI